MLSKDCKVLQSFYKTKVKKFANIAKCCRVFIKKGERNKKNASVAELTVMAELSKCCSASNVAHIAVLSNIASVAEFYKKKEEGNLQMLQSLQM